MGETTEKAISTTASAPRAGGLEAELGKRPTHRKPSAILCRQSKLGGGGAKAVGMYWRIFWERMITRGVRCKEIEVPLAMEASTVNP